MHTWHATRAIVRVSGAWTLPPQEGLRFNPNKLVIDPYAKALTGQVDWSAPVFPYQFGGDDADLTLDERDDAAGIQKCVVVNPYFDWQDDHSPEYR